MWQWASYTHFDITQECEILQDFDISEYLHEFLAGFLSRRKRFRIRLACRQSVAFIPFLVIFF